MVHGVWCMVYGVQYMVHGIWVVRSAPPLALAFKLKSSLCTLAGSYSEGATMSQSIILAHKGENLV